MPNTKLTREKLKVHFHYSRMIYLIVVVLAVLAAGGAGYYFKVYRAKQVHEDYDEGGEYEEIPEPEEKYDDSPPWDEDGELGADEGGGDE